MLTRRQTHRTLLLRIPSIIFSMMTIATCEHIDLAEIEGKADEEVMTTDIVTPLRTGEGTMDAPYTVTDVLQQGETLLNREVWVIGYAVGTAYNGMKNALFVPPFEHDSNILLSGKADCTETANCMPVKLNKNKLKEGLSLLSKPAMFHQCLIIQGSIGKYLNTYGIVAITADINYRWLEGFTIPSSAPTDWEQDTISFKY